MILWQFWFFLGMCIIALVTGGVALWAMKKIEPGDSPDWAEWNEQEKALKKRMKEWKQ